MKFSKQSLVKLKNKNKKLKRQAFRGRIKGTKECPRLSIYCSNENIYAQIIDDTNVKTLVTCSTLERSIIALTATRGNCTASQIMGERLAKMGLEKNITKIVFDRGPYLYHGRIKALADGVRTGGLRF